MSTPQPRDIVVIAHNLRSVYNVGSLLRTGEVFAVNKVYVSGFTPYPDHRGDTRDARLRDVQTRRMAKTAAGAERTMPLEHREDVLGLLVELGDAGYTVAGLENEPTAFALGTYPPPAKLALVLGDEVHGITAEIREMCEVLLRIPVYGGKETLNVSVAAGIALYALRAG